MKRLYLLLIAFVICLSSCNLNEKDILRQIYVVYTGQDSNTHKDINFVSREPVHSVQNDAEINKTVKILDNEFDAVYKETLFYPIGNYEVNQYTVGEGSILLRKDGSVKSVLGVKIGEINISPTDSHEEVQALLEPFIADAVNVSKYEQLNVTKQGSNDNEDHFGHYNFVYYNEVQGYMTDWVSIYVDDDGTISRMVIQNLSEDINGLDIDKKHEDKLISTELSSLYNTDTTQYVSYEQSKQPQIVLFNNELHVRYTLETGFKQFFNNQSDNSEPPTINMIDEILIPLELLTDS